jgi:hypothetical protein
MMPMLLLILALAGVALLSATANLQEQEMRDREADMRARKAAMQKASASKDPEPKKAATQSDSEIHPSHPFHPYLRHTSTKAPQEWCLNGFCNHPPEDQCPLECCFGKTCEPDALSGTGFSCALSTGTGGSTQGQVTVYYVYYVYYVY